MVNLHRIQSALHSKKWRFILSSYESGEFIIDILTHLIPHINPQSWMQRLKFGGVYVNGKLCQENIKVNIPAAIEYFETNFSIDSAALFFPPFTDSWILYQDQYLLACYKPAKLPCLPTRDQKYYNLHSYIEKYLKRKIHMPSRLDTSTEGIVLISINESSHKKLQLLYEQRKIQKNYILKTHILPDWEEITVDSPIGKNPEHPILRKIGGPQAKSALTDFKILNREKGSIVSAKPHTGRTHQIRIHAAHIGIPIQGDNFYEGEPADKLHLVSYSIALNHPLTNEPLYIKATKKHLPDWLISSSIPINFW